MSHLGRWLSAQIDGELDGVERDRVLNHLAGCEACRREANALRALKRRMIALGDSAADSAIAGWLIERARSEPDLVPDAPGGAQRHLPRPEPDLRSRPSRSRQAWPCWGLAAGAAGSGLVAIGLLAFMLGGGQGARPIPKVSPAVDSYWVQHSFDTGQKPATGAVLIQSLLPGTGQHSILKHSTLGHSAHKPTTSARAKVRRHHSAR